MMTSTEKWVLSESPLRSIAFTHNYTDNSMYKDSFLFLTVSLVLIASSLYLPSHICTVTSRAFYYWSGGNTGATFYNFTKNPISTTSATIVHASEIVASNAQVLASKGSNLAKGMMGSAVSDNLDSMGHQNSLTTSVCD